MKNIQIPENVERIGNSAFNGCRSLEDIIIPNKVTEIGDMAFQGCEKIIDITIPDSIVKIGKKAFKDCKNLKNVVLPGHLIDIADDAFTGCPNVTFLTKKEYKLKQSVLSNEQSPVSKSLELPKEKNLSEFDEMTQELVKAFQNLSFPDKMEIMNLVLKKTQI